MRSRTKMTKNMVDRMISYAKFDVTVHLGKSQSCRCFGKTMQYISKNLIKDCKDYVSKQTWQSTGITIFEISLKIKANLCISKASNYFVFFIYFIKMQLGSESKQII